MRCHLKPIDTCSQKLCRKALLPTGPQRQAAHTSSTISAAAPAATNPPSSRRAPVVGMPLGLPSPEGFSHCHPAATLMHGSGMGPIAMTTMPPALAKVCANFSWWKPTPPVANLLPAQAALHRRCRDGDGFSWGLSASTRPRRPLQPSIPPHTQHAALHAHLLFSLKYHICFPTLLNSCLNK